MVLTQSGKALLRSLSCIALVLAACTPTATPAASPPQPAAARLGTMPADRIQILHTNDIHGHLDAEEIKTGSSTFLQGGMALMAGAVTDLRLRAPERTLLLDGGDAWQGTFISNANHGEAVTEAMSLMRYDAQAIGNHDFDWGQDVLSQRAKEATFPFLAANVVEQRTGAIPGYAKPYIVKDLGIARLAILGLTNPGSASIVKASSVAGLRFLPSVETVQKYLPELQRQADVIVVITHIGLDDDTKLAQAVPDIDLIVGAHSHTALKTARSVGKTTIVQTGAYAANLGHVELTIDPATKRVTNITRADELITIAQGVAKPDPDVAKIVDQRRAEAQQFTVRIVGKTVQPLDNPRAECGLGNLIADALLDYGRRQGWKSDVAFYNMAGVRAPLPAGDISYGQLYEVLPFTNTVVTVDLTGALLRDTLEATASSAGRLHLAGATYAYKLSNPAGQRFVSATVGGTPLDLARVYHVVTIDYLLTGGDNHQTFAKGTNTAYGDIEVDVVASYMAAHSPLNPQVEGRIVTQ